MNFIRENLLKIVIILVVIVVVIFFMSSCRKATPVTTGQKYEIMENNMVSAAQNFVASNKKLLPSEIGASKKITLSTLVKNNKIKQLYANENSNVSCTGYVSIIKTSETNYLYRPFLKCGKYYETKTIAEQILSTEDIVTSGNGLYQDADGYIYRGEKPNNYIIIGERTYRILSINSEKELKLVVQNSIRTTYKWDDRYNTTTRRNSGINDFDKSRIRDSLDELYSKVEEPYFSTEEKNFIVSHNFCTGKLSMESFSLPVSRENECSAQTELHVGLMNPSDYIKPSLDNSCTSGKTASCQNYNYLYTDISSFIVTLNASSDDTYSVVAVDDGVLENINARSSIHIYPVVYISKTTLFKSGNGSIDNPYRVR